jgi:hypothetical protein
LQHELQRGRSEGVRLEKVFGFIGLGLFFLFPLVGLLQMGDADATWRAVAARTAASVWRVEAGGAAASGVVVDRDPLRLAVAGTLPEAETRVSGARLRWLAAYIDPSGEFTILSPTSVVSSASVTAIDPAVIGDLDAEIESGVEAVLVGAADSPLWVGELRVTRQPGGRRSFRALALRPLRAGVDSTGTAPSFDPTLRGAPFVTRDGVVLALCAGTGDAGVFAVPMARVREAVALLDRSARKTTRPVSTASMP